MAEFKDDIDILVECLKCQQKNPVSLRQSLMTLSTLVSTDDAKDYFRESGGLKYVYNQLLRAESTDIKIATLFCLASAVEKNVFSQKMLTNQSVFSINHEILQNSSTSHKLQQASVFFLLCLVANNSQAQNQARETGCLADLMDIFRQLLNNGKINIADEIGPIGLVTSALSMCVNNPQNEENQRLCSSLLPSIFSVISSIFSSQILSPVLSLTGIMVACNVFNQDRVCKCGGLDVLVTCLHHLTERGREEEDCLTAAVQVVSTLDSCITDNECNIRKFREACGTGPLFTLLTPGLLSQQEQLQVVITLSHMLSTNSGGANLLSAVDYQKLVCLLTQTEDEELIKALKYVLHMCKNPADDDKLKKKQSASNGEPNLKQSNHLILRKIDELAAKLDMYQGESRQDSSMQDQNNSCSVPVTNSLMDSLADIQVGNQAKLSRGMSDVVSERMKSLFGEKNSAPSPPPVNSENESMDVQEASSHMLNWLKHLIPHFIRSGRVEENKSKTERIHGLQPSQFEEPLMTLNESLGKQNVSLNRDQHRMNSSVTSPFMQRPPVHGRSSCYRSSVIDRLNRDFTLDNGNLPLSGGIAREHVPQTSLGGMNQFDCRGYQDFQAQGVPSYGNSYLGDDLLDREPSTNNQRHSVIDYQHGYMGGRFDAGYVHGHDVQRLGTERCVCSVCSQSQDNRHPQFFRYSERTENFTIAQGNSSDHGRYSEVLQSKVPESRTHCCNCAPDNINKSCSACVDNYVENTLDKVTPESESYEASEVFDGNENHSCFSHSKSTVCNVHQAEGKRNNKCDQNSGRFSERETTLCDEDIFTSEQVSVPRCHKKIETTSQIQKLSGSVNSISESGRDTAKSERSVSKSRGSSDLSSKGRQFGLTPSKTTSARDMLTPDSTKSASSMDFKTPAPPTTQFLKPNIVSLRRRVKTPSTCGSASSSIGSRHNVRVLARKSVVGIQPNPVSEIEVLRQQPTYGLHSPRITLLPSPRVTPLPSPVHSEFDFALLKSANMTRQKECKQSYRTFTPMVKKLNSNNLKCWTDVHPTVCPAPTYSKALSTVTWSQFSDTDSESPYSHTDDSNYSGDTEEDVERTGDEDDQMDISFSRPELCPACYPPCSSNLPVLNSRTYNIALETTTGTCRRHRKLRCVERQFILKRKSLKGFPRKIRPLPELGNRNPGYSCPPARRLSVYDFHPSSEDSELGVKHVSPPRTNAYLGKGPNFPVHAGSRKRRRKRKRVAYSEEETKNLHHGVEKLGTKWNQILVTYKFHPSRTAVDLKEKHNRLMKADQESKKRKKCGRPFSMCEERRLRRGVKTLGYNWKGILQMFRFTRGRTSEQLRNKWRTLMRREEQ